MKRAGVLLALFGLFDNCAKNPPLLQSRAAQHCRRAAPGNSFKAGILLVKHLFSSYSSCPPHFPPMFFVTEMLCVYKGGREHRKKVRSTITVRRLNLMLYK